MANNPLRILGSESPRSWGGGGMGKRREKGMGRDVMISSLYIHALTENQRVGIIFLETLTDIIIWIYKQLDTF